MQKVIAACLVIGLAACHSAPRTAVDPSTRTLGTFAYHANITGQHEEVGTFTIAADTVVVDATDEICRRYVEKTLSERTHNFDCTGAYGVKQLTLTIDSRNPTLSRWYAVRTENRSRKVCAAQALTPDGRQVCVQYRTEMYEAEIPFGGPLRVSVALADSGR